MKKLSIYISLLFVLTCAKEDSQAPNTVPSQIIKQYTLTASAVDGGSVSISEGVFNPGALVTIQASPNSGYQFSSWSNGSTNNPISITMSSNVTITANFTLIPIYTISLYAEDGGSVNSEGGDYNEGTEVTLTATPNDGYEFTGWSDGNTEATRVIIANEDLTLTATFSELATSYTLIVTSQDGGSVNSEGGDYNEGTEVTLTATPNDGYKFTGWSDGNTEATRNIEIIQNLTLEAIFRKVDGLIAHYKFDDNLKNELTNSNSFQNIGGTYVSNRLLSESGYSISLQGDRDEAHYLYLDLEDLKLNKFTYSVWVKFNNIRDYINQNGPYDYQNFNPQTIFSINSNDWDIGPAINLVLRTNSENQNFIRYFHWTNGNHEVIDSDFNLIQENNWHNISVTYDSSITKLFIDGVLIGEKNMELSYENQYDFLIGGKRNGAQMNVMGPLMGSVDDLKIYNYALSSSEIQELSYCNDCNNSPENINSDEDESDSNNSQNISSNYEVLNLVPNSSVQLIPSIVENNDATFNFEIENPSLANIDSNGIITTNNIIGETNLIVTSSDTDYILNVPLIVGKITSFISFNTATSMVNLFNTQFGSSDGLGSIIINNSSVETIQLESISLYSRGVPPIAFTEFTRDDYPEQFPLLNPGESKGLVYTDITYLLTYPEFTWTFTFNGELYTMVHKY